MLGYQGSSELKVLKVLGGFTSTTSSFFTFIERRWQTLRARGAGDDLRYT